MTKQEAAQANFSKGYNCCQAVLVAFREELGMTEEQAARLGSKLLQSGGTLTEFERECDDALTGCLAAARRVPFGEEPVIGYLYAREQELTAIRSIFAGRAAGLDGETIRSRLRRTYV